VKDQKRTIEKSSRKIEQEKHKLESEQTKMRNEIKKLANAGQHNAAKMLAKDYARISGQKEKMSNVSGQLKAVSYRVGAANTLNEVSNAFQSAGTAMSSVNAKIDTGKLVTTSKNLAKQDALFDMKQDMVDDILNGIGEGNDDSVEEDKVYQQVLAEVGLEVKDSMPSAGTKKVNAPEKEKQKMKVDDELEAMLKELQINI